MPDLTVDQLAKMIVGNARSQAAVLRALLPPTAPLPIHVMQSLQTAAGLSQNPPVPISLETLQLRVLLQIIEASQHSDPAAWIRTELEKLL